VIDLLYKPAAVLVQEQNKKKVTEWRKLQVTRTNFLLFLNKNPVCDLCGKPSQLPHHLYDTDYHTLKAYIEALWNGHAIPLCNSCHHSGHKTGTNIKSEKDPLQKERNELTKIRLRNLARKIRHEQYMRIKAWKIQW
jgi:hypothetical protein